MGRHGRPPCPKERDAALAKAQRPRGRERDVAAAAVERNVRADVLELLATLRNALAGGFVPSNTENALLSSLVAPVVARPYSQLGAPARCFVDADGMPVREELDTDRPRPTSTPSWPSTTSGSTLNYTPTRLPTRAA